MPDLVIIGSGESPHPRMHASKAFALMKFLGRHSIRKVEFDSIPTSRSCSGPEPPHFSNLISTIRNQSKLKGFPSLSRIHPICILPSCLSQKLTAFWNHREWVSPLDWNTKMIGNGPVAMFLDRIEHIAQSPPVVA